MSSTAQAAPSTRGSATPQRLGRRVDESRPDALARARAPNSAAQRAAVPARRRRAAAAGRARARHAPATPRVERAARRPGWWSRVSPLQSSGSSVSKGTGSACIERASRISTFCSACLSASWQERASAMPRSNCVSASSSGSSPCSSSLDDGLEFGERLLEIGRTGFFRRQPGPPERRSLAHAGQKGSTRTEARVARGGVDLQRRRT